MKKLLYLVLILPLFLQSCLIDNDNTFDKSSSQRVEEAVEAYKKALVNAPNGWLLQYYPDEDQTFGGYNYIVSFTKEEVTAMFELADNLDESLTSSYSVRVEQGPLLTFDTYNNFLHMFATPSREEYRALGGDFEFVMMGIEGDQIKLRGKRSRNYMTLTKIAAGQDHEALLEKIIEMEESISSPTYTMLVDGKQTASITVSNRNFSIIDVAGNTINGAFIVTTEGIKFYAPITVFGKQVQNFNYLEATDELVCTDGVDAIIKRPTLPINEIFTIMPFYFDGSKIGPALTASFAITKNSLSGTAYSLHNLWLGPDYFDNMPSIAFAVWDTSNARNWWGAFIYEITPTVGTDNELTLRFTNTYDKFGNAPTFIGMAPGLKTFPEFLGGTYILTSDNPAKPKEITLTDKTNPNRWFVLSKEAVDLR